MSSQWETWKKKIDSRSERERVLLFCAVLAVIVLLGVNFIVSPMLKEQEVLNRQLQTNAEQTQTLTLELSNLQTIQSADVNANVKKQIAEHRKMLEFRQQKLKQFQDGLVPAERIDVLLESLLKQNKNLRLVSLQNFPVVDLVGVSGKVESAASSLASTEGGSSKAAVVNQTKGLFKHEVEIVVEGSYFDMLAYLQSLETMRERLYWSQVGLEVIEYPKSRLSLHVYTLSLERKWMGL